MTPEELCDAGIKIYGTSWGWQTYLARDLEVDYVTVKRWVNGTHPIPGPAKKAVELMLEVQALTARLERRGRAVPRGNKK